METKDRAELVVIGAILRPHGIRGDVVVSPHGDVEGFLRRRVRLFARHSDGRAEGCRVLEYRPHQGRWIVHVEGVDDRDAAERLRSVDLCIEECALDDLPEGEFYLFEIVGAEVLNQAGQLVGTVRDVMENGPSDSLVVVTGSSEWMVPFVGRYVLDVRRGEPTAVVLRDYEELMALAGS